MVKRIIEYREMQQLRKDHKAKQKMRHALIFCAIMGTLLVAVAAIEAVMPAKAAKPVSAVSAVPPAKQQEIQDIETFADIVTKPLDTLTSEDIEFMGAKAKDPCYEKNAQLPPEQMIPAIKACKA